MTTPAGVDADAARWRFLALMGAAVVLSMSIWFSATAIIPELTALWDLTASEAAWITNAVQLGFVVGALGSSLLSLADVLRLDRLMAASALLGAAANLVLLAEPGILAAIAARFVTGIALAGVYPPALKMMATWFRRGRGLALGLLIGALTLGSSLPHLVRALSEGSTGGSSSGSPPPPASLPPSSSALRYARAPIPSPAPRSIRARSDPFCATGRSCSQISVISAICGSSTRCGAGSSPLPPRVWRIAPRC